MLGGRVWTGLGCGCRGNLSWNGSGCVCQQGGRLIDGECHYCSNAGMARQELCAWAKRFCRSECMCPGDKPRWTGTACESCPAGAKWTGSECKVQSSSFACGNGRSIEAAVSATIKHRGDSSDENPAMCRTPERCCAATHGCPGESGHGCASELLLPPGDGSLRRSSPGMLPGTVGSVQASRCSIHPPGPTGAKNSAFHWSSVRVSKSAVVFRRCLLGPPLSRQSRRPLASSPESGAVATWRCVRVDRIRV